MKPWEMNWQDVQGAQQGPKPWEQDWSGGQEMRAATPDQSRGLAQVRSNVKPMVSDSTDTSAPFWATIKSSLHPDAQKQIRQLSKDMNIPLEKFGVVDGDIVYQDDSGKISRAVPSIGESTGVLDFLKRLGANVGANIGPTVPQVAGGTAGLLSGPTPASIPIAASAAGVTDMGRQALGNYFLGDPLYDLNLMNSAGQAALAGGSQALAVLGNMAYTKNPLEVSYMDKKNITPQTVQQAQQFAQDARSVGITPTVGQSTGVRSQLVNERQLLRDPASADVMSDFYNQQRGQVSNAVRGFADTVSPVQSTQQGVNQFREGADAAVNAAKAARQQAAGPAYQKVVNPQSVMPDAEVKALMDDPLVEDAFQYVRGNKAFARELKNVPDSALPVWDQVKKRLDDMYQTASRAGNNNEARLIKGALNDLTGKLDTIFPDYPVARQTFANASPAVTALEQGPAGTFAAKEGIEKASELKSMFGANNITSDAVAQTRTAYMKAGRIDDWNAGLATHIRETLAQANGSPSGVLKNLYGGSADPRAREIMKAAMTPDQFGAFEKLMQVIEGVSKTLPEGSPTATDMAGGQALRQSVQGTKGKAVALIGRVLSPTRAIDTAGAASDRILSRLSDDGMAKLAEAVTNPDNISQLRRIRMMNPRGEQALTLTANVLGLGATDQAARGLTDRGLRVPADRPIPAYAP